MKDCYNFTVNYFFFFMIFQETFDINVIPNQNLLQSWKFLKQIY